MLNTFFSETKRNPIKLAPNPEYLYLLNEHGMQQSFTIPQIEIKFDFKWLEWQIDVFKYHVDYPIFLSLNREIIPKYLELRYMGNKCGWGLFSKKKILKGTTIGVFTGEITYKDLNEPIKSDYVFYKEIAKIGKMLVIDATKQGNITRFIQHLPNKKELVFYEYNHEISNNNIAVENLSSSIITINDQLSTIVFITLRDIVPNEVIGSSYGLKCWEKNGKTSYLFKKNGTIIGQLKIDEQKKVSGVVS